MRCESSTYQPISRSHSPCAIRAGNMFSYCAIGTGCCLNARSDEIILLLCIYCVQYFENHDDHKHTSIQTVAS